MKITAIQDNLKRILQEYGNLEAVLEQDNGKECVNFFLVPEKKFVKGKVRVLLCIRCKPAPPN